MSIQTLLANQLVASTALTANILNLDEGVTNFDGVYATYDGVTAANTSLVLGFENPIRPLVSGVDLQTFRARVRKNATAGNTTTVRLEVREAGVLRANSTNFTITSITGENITFTWNANLLVSSTGADVQIAVVQQVGGTGGSPSVRRWIEIDTVDWTADIIDPNIFTFNGSGSFTASGNSRDYISKFNGSGSLSLSGNSLIKEIDSYSSSGSLLVSGNSNQIFRPAAEFIETGFGSLSLSGNSLIKEIDSYSGSGSLLVSGNSLTKEIDLYFGFGSLSLSGNSLTKEVDLYLGSGSLSLSGNSLENKFARYPYSGSGSLSLSGNSLVTKFTRYPYSGSGSLSLSGNSLIKEIDSYSGSGSLLILGGSIDRLVKTLYIYSGSGNLFNVGEKLERFTYDYNEESIEETIVDYGSVLNEVTFFEDYGIVAEDYNSVQDFGFNEESISAFDYPYGSIGFSGEAVEKFTSDYPESTQLFEITGAASGEAVIFSSDNTQLFNISGEGIEKDGDSYVASGSLFSFGEKVERVTYSYNEESIEETIVDYGSINESDITSFEEYGFIIDDYNSIQDFESINLPISPLSYPYGSIGFSGEAVEKFTSDYPESTQLFEITGAASGEGVIFSSKNTQLFVISGEGIEKDGDSYVASGSLFSFGEKVESVTYRYSEESIEETIVDYGSINESEITSFEEYAFIVDDYVSTQDFESINLPISPLSYPYGSIGFSGESVERFTSDYPESTQLFEITGAASGESVIFSSENTQLFNISGQMIERALDHYTSSGSLFSFGEKVERVTYRYSEESIPVSEDYGSILDEAPSFADYELITDQYNSISDSGSIIDSIDPPFNYPYGSINISGSKLESFIESPYIGDKPIYTISGSVSNLKFSFSSSNTQLLKVSGQAKEKDGDSYVGSGTLFSINEGSFKSTNSYRGSGSYGGITGFNILVIRLGIVVGITGKISLSGDSKNYSPIYPGNSGDKSDGIGTIRIVDAETIYRSTLPYKATGSLFALGSGQENFTRKTYRGSGLIKYSGNSVDFKFSDYTEVGFGTITISQQTKPIIIKLTSSYVGFASVIFGNQSINRNIFDYNGSGNILVRSTGKEVFVAQTPDNIISLNITGTKIERIVLQPTESEVVYRFEGKLIERTNRDYFGLGKLILSGTSLSRFIPRPAGQGSIKFVTHLVDNTYDTCDSNLITSDYQDSASYKFVVNPVESTQLFNVSGFGNIINISSKKYIGNTDISISGSNTSVTQVKNYVGIGSVSFEYSSVDIGKEIDSYYGSGSLFAVAGSSSSNSYNPEDNTVILTIGGSSTNNFIKTYSYSGISTVFFNGYSDYEKLQRFSYSGSGNIGLYGELLYPDIIFTPAPKGNGFIGISGTSTERIVYNQELLSGNRTVFAFSSGFESFGKTNYTGIGTIFYEGTESTTINNQYQPPRLYVIII